MNPPTEPPMIAPSGGFDSPIEGDGDDPGSFGFGEEALDEHDFEGKGMYLSGVAGSMAASVRPNWLVS